MATVRTARTHWEGSLLEGHGSVELTSSGSATFEVSWPSRAEAPDGRTSPEELLAAAHATCFAMALSHSLAGAGTPAQRLDTAADVTFQPGEGITGIDLHVKAEVPGLTEEQFAEAAQTAKENCPVSKALAGTEITLAARLVQD